jgi:hypothetical protein
VVGREVDSSLDSLWDLAIGYVGAVADAWDMDAMRYWPIRAQVPIGGVDALDACEMAGVVMATGDLESVETCVVMCVAVGLVVCEPVHAEMSFGWW